MPSSFLEGRRSLDGHRHCRRAATKGPSKIFSAWRFRRGSPGAKLAWPGSPGGGENCEEIPSGLAPARRVGVGGTIVPESHGAVVAKRVLQRKLVNCHPHCRPKGRWPPAADGAIGFANWLARVGGVRHLGPGLLMVARRQLDQPNISPPSLPPNSPGWANSEGVGRAPAGTPDSIQGARGARIALRP